MNHTCVIAIPPGLDWIVHGFTSPPTQYRLYGRRFLQVKRPNQQSKYWRKKATKENPENTKKAQNTHIHKIVDI